MCFLNGLQQFRVKYMVSIPLLWAIFQMSGHDLMSWADISKDSVRGCKVVREVNANILYAFWYSEHTGFHLGGKLDQNYQHKDHVRTSHGRTYHRTGEEKAWELDHYTQQSSLGMYLIDLYQNLMQLKPGKNPHSDVRTWSTVQIWGDLPCYCIGSREEYW